MTASGPLLRWLLSYGAFAVPQAAGPIVFALIALPLTGDPGSGAAIVLAITVAQVIGAVPIARLGRRWNAVGYLRTLVAVRTLALAALAALAAAQASFPVLIAAGALAGLVNGAAFGYLRSVLNYLVETARLPRALGLAATIGEITFVAAPVAASLLGTIDAVMALVVLSLLGALPALLLPAIPHAEVKAPADGRGSLITPPILLWLACTLANSAVVSSIEIGAVALAMRYDYPPAMGFIFTVALCAASVAGGVWVSVRNRMPAHLAVVGTLVLMTTGAALMALHLPVAITIAGALMVGICMSPLSTTYSLRIDELSPPHRKAEIFALARTMNALGIIVTSTTLSLTSLAVTQGVAVALIAVAGGGVFLLGQRK